eukprot:TRINITY_DN95617_c0_g1_i1.p1 TRINITY_DN95617_c0_g1~~TRINITY_DN95617_c0_g1_i1.p1  ORF type:complete len:672 (-),score=219.21 TRINITY_DN95617_c0_g1_i1:262-2277(-)
MQQMMRLLAVANVATLALAQDGQIKKVVKMLEAMKEKSKEVMDQEAVQYAEYKSWCDSEQEGKNADIKDAADSILVLQADVGKAESEAEKLAMNIKELDQNVAGWSADKAGATNLRSSERSKYDTLHKEYTESISATSKAIKVLSAELKSKEANADALALLSSSRLISKATTKEVSKYLQGYESADQLLAKAGGGPVEESSTSSITSLLSTLHDKFVDERATIEKEEAEKIEIYDKLVTSLSGSLKSGTESKEEKISERNLALQEASTRAAELQDTKATKADAESYLAGVKKSCDEKATDFKSRTELRKGELEAMAKAIELISGGLEAETRQSSKLSGLLLQKSATVSLAQLRSARARNPAQEKAANYLQAMAEKMDSSLLSSAAERLEADPLAKVKTMVESLIKRLESEGNAQLDKHQWCSKEIGENRKTRSKATMQAEVLKGEIDATSTRLAKLSDDILEINGQLAQQAESFATAQKDRLASKKENEQTIEDAKQAQQAVTTGIKVLKDFYKTASKKKSLLQVSKDSAETSQAPKIFDKPYDGADNGGVLALLDLIHSDYAKLETSTLVAESKAAKAFDELDSETKILKGQREKDVEHKTKETLDLKQGMVHYEADLETAQKELAAAEKYNENLKEECLKSGPSHEEIEARRKEELAALEEALKMLEAE